MTSWRSDRKAFGDLNVQQSDVSSRYIVGLINNGGSVAGATLDLCNGNFPSERLRTARRQVAAVDSLGPLGLSTGSRALCWTLPAGGAGAGASCAAFVRSCPGGPPDRQPQRRGGPRSLPPGSFARPDVGESVAKVERIAFDVNTTDGLGAREHPVAVYLRRGRVLMGVYSRARPRRNSRSRVTRHSPRASRASSRPASRNFPTRL